MPAAAPKRTHAAEPRRDAAGAAGDRRRAARRGPTSYQLRIVVARPLHRLIGRLGEFDFPAGCYVYSGSARRNLQARIARHLRPDKALRWHIDHLLTAPGVRIVGVLCSARSECSLHRRTRGSIPVPGFGASDCCHGCGAHLKYLGPSPAALGWCDPAAVADTAPSADPGAVRGPRPRAAAAAAAAGNTATAGRRPVAERGRER